MSKYFGSKEYYLNVLKIGLPLALGNLLQSCMSTVDGIMVSSIGMVTAVGNARNITTLNDLVEYGIITGISMFAAQFYGAKQKENLNKTFGLCVLLTFLNVLFWFTVTYTIGYKLLYFFLPDPEVCEYSLTYLKILIVAMFPGALSFSIATLFRSTHETKLPFRITIVGSIVNVVCNYLFINVFNLGIAGAGYGTLCGAITNCSLFITALIKRKPEFFADIKKMFKLNLDFVIPVIEKIIPLVLNEALFGVGQVLFAKAYGMLGTQSMDAYYVANEIFNLFAFLIWGFGNAVGIVIGTTLGQGKIEQAKVESKYQLALSTIIGGALCALVIAFAPLVIKFYHVTNPVTYEWTKGLLYVFALKIFFRTFNFMMFSTLKAGGDSKIINFLDSGIMYIVGIPIAFISVKFNLGNIVFVLLVCQIEQIVRFFVTLKRYNSGVWANDLTKIVA